MQCSLPMRFLYLIILCDWAFNFTGVVTRKLAECLSLAIFVMLVVGFSVAPVTLLASMAILVDDSVMLALGIYSAGESATLALLHVLFW